MPLPPLKMTCIIKHNRNQFEHIKKTQKRSQSLIKHIINSSRHTKSPIFSHKTFHSNQNNKNNSKYKAILTRQNLLTNNLVNLSLKNIKSQIALKTADNQKVNMRSPTQPSSMCLNLKSQERNSKQYNDPKINGSAIKLRIRTELYETPTKLSKLNSSNQNFQTPYKKYSQLSLKQIVEKNTALYLWNKKSLIIKNKSSSSNQQQQPQPFEGW